MATERTEGAIVSPPAGSGLVGSVVVGDADAL